jgi:hypothetical protein
VGGGGFLGAPTETTGTGATHNLSQYCITMSRPVAKRDGALNIDPSGVDESYAPMDSLSVTDDLMATGTASVAAPVSGLVDGGREAHSIPASAMPLGQGTAGRPDGSSDWSGVPSRGKGPQEEGDVFTVPAPVSVPTGHQGPPSFAQSEFYTVRCNFLLFFSCLTRQS